MARSILPIQAKIKALQLSAKGVGIADGKGAAEKIESCRLIMLVEGNDEACQRERDRNAMPREQKSRHSFHRASRNNQGGSMSVRLATCQIAKMRSRKSVNHPHR